MITSFKSLGQNGGGGGGGYTLPVASQSTLGGVKIGNGIDIDSAGTISVTGGTGGGIEVVTELPSSGTDGQMVLLETVIPEMHIHITGMGTNSNPTQSVTAIGITTKTKLFDYNNYSTLCPVYVNPDGSYSIYDPFLEQENIYPVGETTAYTITNAGRDMSVTGVVTTTGCTFTVNPASTWRENAINDIDQHEEEKQVLYTWSDSQELIADIDYTTIETGTDWCARFKYSELPNATLIVTKYKFGESYYHYVHNNGELRMYESASADTYTATTYQTIAKYGVITNVGRSGVYWTDDDLVFFAGNSGYRKSINLNAFYKTGWHKDLGHRVSNKAFYKDYTWFDEDYNIIIKNQSYTMNDVSFKVNGGTNYVYSKNNGSLPTIFAPTTSASTGYVCVAGNGNSAPTWVSPDTITNGVKFWKGTQDQYDAIGEGNYDASTLYIIIPD